MKRLMLALVAGAVLVGAGAPIATAAADWRYEECRFKTVGSGHRWTAHKVGLLITCVSDHEGINPDVPRGIYHCETGHPYEYPHSDSYHGPLQYLESTFQGQVEAMPWVVRRYDLHPGVHNIKANLTIGIAWMARHSTSPWSGCA